jgi:predicted RNA-binding protein YlxR (DUF448 family)
MTVPAPTAAPAVGRPKRFPIRTCVACRTSGGKRGLLRIVRLPGEGGVILDPTGKKSGRGAYVCPTAACVALALKQKRLERSLKASISEEMAEALRQAAEAAAETVSETPPDT